MAIGNAAMQNSVSGINNVAIGNLAMQKATGTNGNIAIGNQAMLNSFSGSNNIALGQNTLQNITGSNNIAVGLAALSSASKANNNVAIGANTLGRLQTGTNNIAIGIIRGASGAGSSLTSVESNDIYIGHVGVAGESNAIRIGTTGTQTTAYVAGIFGTTTTLGGAISVLVNNNGQLGTVSSSRNYKKDIQTIEGEHDKMLKLRPVTFTYKHDETNSKQYGLIAEEVNEIYPEIVVRNNGEIYSINYMALIPMLLKYIQELEQQVIMQNEQMQKQDERVRVLDSQMQDQKDYNNKLDMQINELRALVMRLLDLNNDSIKDVAH